MTGTAFLSLAPLALTGLAGIVGMAMAPVASLRAIRGTTAALMILALAVVALRAGAVPAPAYAILADDALARLGAGLALLAGLGILAFVRDEDGAREGPALVAIAAAGGVALAGATNGAVLILGLEITTLAMVALALLPRSAPAAEAGYKLFLMGGVSAATLLLGAAFAFAGTGSLALADWGGSSGLAAVGGALLLAGLAFKFSLAPFHMWVPDLFSGAPASAAALAGALSKVATGVALLRLAEVAPGGAVWTLGLGVTGAAAALLGNIVALRQESLARMLGYSTIAHSGYLAMILAAGGPLAGEALLVYLAAYAPAVVAALCVASALGGVSRSELRGLVRRHPLAGFALGLALLSMVGLPPTVGFLGKVYLFSALAAAEAWALLAAAAVGAAVAFYYYLRFGIAALAAPDGEETVAAPVLSGGATVMLAGALALIVLPGLYPEPLLALAAAAAP
ncbi:NADH-quinone oxidoreductase subunit N [Rhodosalinus sp.]|uniref:NADH-quinone oxidoreductase subunit N n=1 Tax=Rhodosalinus sp. TaxID=2047741 RepID=UPI003567FE22